MFGSPETTSGGRALKFYSSVRMDIRRIGALKDGQDNIGNRVRVKVVKNKMAPPFRETELDIMFGTGFSWEGDILDLALQANLVQKSGSWFSYGEDRLGQGKENVKGFFKDNPDLLEKLVGEVKQFLGMEPVETTEAAKPAE